MMTTTIMSHFISFTRSVCFVCADFTWQ